MQEKPFDLTSIVVLLILAITNDALIVFADIAFFIPIIGQISFLVMMAASFVIWGIIFLWFTMKLGFAGPIGLLQIGGGLLAEIGIPARTATVLTGIFMANNPKAAKLGKLAGEAALVAATGGAGAGVVAAEGAAAGAGAVTAESAAAGVGAAAGAAEEAAAGAAEGAAGKAAGAAAKEIPETAFGMPEEVEAQKQHELFEEISEAKAKKEEVEEEEKEPEIEAGRLGGAYKYTAEEQQKEALKKAGLTEEFGVPTEKSKEIEANGTVVNLKGGSENLKKAA